jgi:hypothetical protein
MQVLVADTSVLVDLERGHLLEAAFRLPYAFAVPDLLYKQELRDANGPALVQLGLRVEALEAPGLALALSYRQRQPALSLPDTFALALAKTGGFILLTGDQLLRALAEAEAVECHGVLWVLDRMQEAGATAIAHLYNGLQAIAGHPRCRLPKREVQHRLERFARQGKVNSS